MLDDSDSSNFDQLDSVEQDDFTIYSHDSHSYSGFQVMEQLRRNGKLCDVTLKVGEQCFSAHRVVLASVVPYFHAMFTHDMVESSMPEINMQGIEASALEELVNFAYSGKIKIDSEKVQSLLVGSSFLQLEHVKDACASFLKNRLSAPSVLGVRVFAETFSCMSLTEATNRYLQKYFVQVAEEEEFMNLEFAEVLEIIGRDELNVASESDVFEAAMAWVKYKEADRAHHLPELMKKIRMPLLTPHYLIDRVTNETLIKSSHQCRDLVDEAKVYHLMPERRPQLKNFCTSPRFCRDVGWLIYVVGGITKSGDSQSIVEVYDPVRSRWQMSESMCMMRSRVGVVAMDDRLYAVGGYDGDDRLSTVEVFDVGSRMWSKVAPMNQKRSAVGAAVLHSQLYVCGGYNGETSLNSVERYNAERDEWRMLEAMSSYRSAAGVVAFEGYVYAIGGHDGLQIFDTVERYDPTARTWARVPPMLSRRCRLGAAALQGRLYVCGGYDGSSFSRSVEVFDPVTSKWSYVANMLVPRSRVALVANMGLLYAIGGYDGTTNLSTCEVYDPANDTWQFIAPMCAHEGGVGVGVLPHTRRN